MVAVVAPVAWAQQEAAPDRLPTIVVEGRSDSLVGTAQAASTGSIGGDELAARPLPRVAEVLEAVPGVVVTQHSGSGKGNQMFARGFDLDHGTDLATRVNGVRVNLPSHGHGQGYTDLGFVIPELIDTVSWRLGPYDVRDGDFASVGAIDIDYVRVLPAGFAKVTIGGYGYGRTLLADSWRVGDSDLLAAVELQQDDGRWTVDQDYAKANGHLAWTAGAWHFAAEGTHADWTATDQIPRRAVRAGALGRFDSLDPTDGGVSERYALRAEYAPPVADGELRVRAFGLGQELELWSNFTYFAADPARGDQFEQVDRRVAYGCDLMRRMATTLGGLRSTNLFGLELRRDDVTNGLFGTTTRVRHSTVRRDELSVSAIGGFVGNELQWTHWLRSSVGLRGDLQFYEVASDLAANSGRDHDAIWSPKAGLVFGPFGETEIYLNGGHGFHSNDARGVLLRDDPTTAAAGDGVPVPGLVRTRGAELGARTAGFGGLQSTVSAWLLELDSELVFVGDAGATEAMRGSRHAGLEFANAWSPDDVWTFDCNLSLSRARYRGDDPAGDRVPGSVPVALTAGVAADWGQGVAASLRVRHLGNRPLLEDGSVESSSTTLVNARFAFEVAHGRELALEVLNLFDQRDSDIEYYYASQLSGEPAPVDDVHFHPVEPFTLRFTVTARF